MEENDTGKLYAQMKELSVKIDHLTELFNRAAYGEGFARCANHANRLRHAEEGIGLCHARIGGVKKWLAAALVSLVSMLANILWNMLRSH